MELFYPEKHKVEIGYGESDELSPIIKELHWRENLNEEYKTSVSEVTFIIRGKLTISWDADKQKDLEKGQLYYLPPDSHIQISTYEPITLWVIRIFDIFNLCEDFSLTNLTEKKLHYVDSFNPIIINPKLEEYISFFISSMKDGLCSKHFIDLKIRELFFILTKYYSRESLTGLFYSVLSNKQKFSDFVMKNYQSVKTVKELAERSTYSLSGFEKEFKKVFGMPAYRWMLNKKIKLVYHELVFTSKPLKIIADECRFSSVTQLNDFCKKYLGHSPGKLREKQSK